MNSKNLDNRLTVTGWGKITNNAKVNLNSLLNYQASARKLSKAKIPGVAIRRCQKENLYKNRLDPKVQLCAGGEEGTISQLDEIHHSKGLVCLDKILTWKMPFSVHCEKKIVLD